MFAGFSILTSLLFSQQCYQHLKRHPWPYPPNACNNPEHPIFLNTPYERKATRTNSHRQPSAQPSGPGMDKHAIRWRKVLTAPLVGPVGALSLPIAEPGHRNASVTTRSLPRQVTPCLLCRDDQEAKPRELLASVGTREHLFMISRSQRLFRKVFLQRIPRRTIGGSAPKNPREFDSTDPSEPCLLVFCCCCLDYHLPPCFPIRMGQTYSCLKRHTYFFQFCFSLKG